MTEVQEPTTASATATGAELAVETLIDLGVEHIFNIMGLGMIPLGDACFKYRDKITYVSSMNEKPFPRSQAS